MTFNWNNVKDHEKLLRGFPENFELFAYICEEQNFSRELSMRNRNMRKGKRTLVFKNPHDNISFNLIFVVLNWFVADFHVTQQFVETIESDEFSFVFWRNFQSLEQTEEEESFY